MAAVPAAKLASYEQLVATNPKVERKGASMPYTSVNGHMFSFLTPKGTLALRLPAGAREAFLKKYRADLCVQHGRVMQEYVEVPATLLKKTKELKKYFAQSYAYVGSLAHKATTRKKKAGAKKATRKVAKKKSTATKKTTRQKTAKKTTTRKTAAKKKTARRTTAKKARTRRR